MGPTDGVFAGRRQGGRPPREAASPSALAPALLRWLRARGKDVGGALEQTGLEPADLERDEAPITAAGLATLLTLASDIMIEPHLALRLPAELTFKKYDAGALAARVAASPRDVLHAMARFAALVFPRLEGHVVETETELRFHARLGGTSGAAGSKARHEVDEYILALALTHCRRGGTSLTPKRVWLASARAPGDLGPLLRAFGTDEIEHGAEDTGLSLALADGALALPACDPMLVAAAEQVAAAALAGAPRAGALASAVSAKIEAALATGPVTAESIAKAMRMSGRTLQRRLDDEGVRFSLLLDDVRERIARRLLVESREPIAAIAFRVGFTDIATFSRAFKRWTGIPPGTFRRKATANRDGAS